MIERSVHVYLTVSELAAEFAKLYASDQAEFFRLVAKEFHSWGASREDAQISMIAASLLGDGQAATWIRRLTAFTDEEGLL